jgi:two-component system, cell cycle sensor histidine kinase and response regulator CckA
VESWQQRKDGKKRLLAWWCRVLKDARGEVAGALSTASDITERKRAEEALRESEERFRDLYDNAPVGYREYDSEGRITNVNRTDLEMLGYTREEMIGHFPWEFAVEEEAARKLILSKLAGTEPPSRGLERTYRRKDGTTLQVLIEDRSILDGEGRLTGMRSTIQDITERKRAEEAMRESEERFRKVFEEGPIGMVLTSRNLEFFRSNPIFCQMLGYTEGEMNSKTFLEVTHPEHRDVDRENVENMWEGKLLHYRTQKRYIAKNGDILWGSLSTSLIRGKDGKPLYALAMIEDITKRKRVEEERKSLEERLNRAEKMEALGTMAGRVAHDLNNVLGVLVGYSELLLMEIPKGNPLVEHVSHIMQSGQKAVAIVQDLLTLARRGVAVSQVVNLNDVISNHLKTPEFARLKSYHTSVTFKSNLEKDLLNIKGSPVHLEKTLMNLVSNAAEAISGHGEVTIVTENRYLDKPVTGYDHIQEGDYVILRVSDNGMGISAADLKKIFEPFYTKKSMGRSGTGLGLAVVWGTVKDHYGYIDVRSEEGKGTTFALYFPVTREEVAADKGVLSPESYMGRGESILVVDDVRDQRELATAMLSSLGYRVSSVSSGEEAVTYLKANEVDLLVLDMIMDPGMDGLDTYQKILEINPKQKAIIVSGFSETGRVKKAQELGAGAYVKKPYIRERIGMAVRKELDRS